MPSQEGGVNIYAVIWNIMLVCMILPYAYKSGLPFNVPFVAATLAQGFQSWQSCAVLAKNVCLHAAAVVVAVGWDI